MDAKPTAGTGKEKISLTLPTEVVDSLKIHALLEGIKPRELVENLIREHLRKWEIIDERHLYETA